MITVNNVKTVIDADHFILRLKHEDHRLFAFLLCADEHEEFISAIKDCWNTLHRLSGSSCDIFTLERMKPIEQHSRASSFAAKNMSPQLKRAGATSSRKGKISQPIAGLENGLDFPDRAQCFDVRDTLFKSPQKIILPGLVVFHSVEQGNAKYYACGTLNSQEISRLFQIVFSTIAQGYRAGKDRQQNFNSFVQQEKIRQLKEYAVSAVMKLSLGDLIKAVGTAGKLAMPAPDGAAVGG